MGEIELHACIVAWDRGSAPVSHLDVAPTFGSLRGAGIGADPACVEIRDRIGQLTDGDELRSRRFGGLDVETVEAELDDSLRHPRGIEPVRIARIFETHDEVLEPVGGVMGLVGGDAGGRACVFERAEPEVGELAALIGSARGWNADDEGLVGGEVVVPEGHPATDDPGLRSGDISGPRVLASRKVSGPFSMSSGQQRTDEAMSSAARGFVRQPSSASLSSSGRPPSRAIDVDRSWIRVVPDRPDLANVENRRVGRIHECARAGHIGAELHRKGAVVADAMASSGR